MNSGCELIKQTRGKTYRFLSTRSETDREMKRLSSLTPSLYLSRVPPSLPPSLPLSPALSPSLSRLPPSLSLSLSCPPSPLSLLLPPSLPARKARLPSYFPNLPSSIQWHAIHINGGMILTGQRRNLLTSNWLSLP